MRFRSSAGSSGPPALAGMSEKRLSILTSVPKIFA
jgi:hypothetical protein